MARTRINDVRVRKKQLLEICMKLAVKHGYQNITRKMIADLADMTPAGISWVFGTVANMERDIVRYAIFNEHLQVVAQIISTKNKYARKKISDELRGRVAEYISTIK